MKEYYYYYSCLDDDETCEYCKSMDGYTMLKKPRISDYTDANRGGGHKRCTAKECRCCLIGVGDEESTKAIVAYLKKHKGVATEDEINALRKTLRGKA